MSTPGGLNPADLYEYLVKARAKLLAWVRPLTYEQYTREFPLGLKTLRNTFVEMPGAEWNYNRRLRGENVPPRADHPFNRFYETEFAPLERAWQEQVEETRRTLRETTDWNKRIEYTPMLRGELQPNVRVRTTTGGIAAQLLFHEIHHRAQAMAMLRQLGIPAENLDYGILMFERVEVPA